MPNLIYTAEVNNALIDQFSIEGIGFPDQTMLNPETGEPDVSVLERMTGISRAIRRLESKVKPGARLMDLQRTSAGRLKLLINDLHNLHQLLHNKTKKTGGLRSWERVIFNAIDPTWYEPVSAATQRFDALAQADREALQAMLDKRLDWVDTAKKLEPEIRDFINRREYFKQLGGLVGANAFSTGYTRYDCGRRDARSSQALTGVRICPGERNRAWNRAAQTLPGS